MSAANGQHAPLSVYPLRVERARPTGSLRLRLPYPLRNALGRWRALLSMMLGVGIALSIGMTILGVISAEMDLLTGDYERSGVGVYVSTQGGKIVARLAGDTPGTIRDASTVLAQVRGWPEVQSAIGAMTWTMERQTEGPRRRGQPIRADGGDRRRRRSDLRERHAGDRSGPVAARRQRSRHRPHSLRATRVCMSATTLRLNGSTFTIVGVGLLRGFSSFGQNSVVYMDLRTLAQRAPVGNVVNVLAIATDQPQRVVERINDLGGLAAWTPAQLVSEAQQASASGIAIDWILIGLTLGVAGLFVNTMLSHSVSERRAEFAVLRAIGFPSVVDRFDGRPRVTVDHGGRRCDRGRDQPHVRLGDQCHYRGAVRTRVAVPRRHLAVAADLRACGRARHGVRRGTCS